MTEFSWDYVTRTTEEAMVDLGRSACATIGQAVEPGVYVVEPNIVYEVRDDSVVLRNGSLIFGEWANPDDATLVAVALEMAGLSLSVDLRSSAGSFAAV